MNDLEYLNSISPTSAQKKPALPFFDKKMKIVLFSLLGAVIVAVATAVLVPMLTPEPANPSADLSLVYARASSLETVVSTYNSKISSPSLRAAGTTLDTILTDLSSRTSSTLAETYKIKKPTISANETSAFQKATEKLESARLNGLLERAYASEIAYQISRLSLAEEAALESVSDSPTRDYLSSSYTSLAQLYETFSSYSE
ncbi:hypothetical protein IJI72_03005 [Candidatus Saccharibacteria bacterium]|nr:hypothetical protein [Candidatus Saccharibacteria bacterium]